MRRTTWTLAVVAVVTLGLGCELAPGKPFSWRSTINTQFPIGDGEDREIGYWHFADPFEFRPGAVSLKMSYRADQTQGPTSPDGLAFRFRVYDPSFTNVKFQYDLDTAGKMKQKGCCAYNVSFKGKDGAFPGWNVEGGDNLVWSVVPTGGTLPSGVGLGINYVYTVAR
jgi:hypothetical protein